MYSIKNMLNFINKIGSLGKSNILYYIIIKI